MTPQQFKQLWESKLQNLSALEPEILGALSLNPTTVRYLTVAGLPADAAPYLSFVQHSAEPFESIGLLTQYYDFLEPEFNRYVYIGFCSDGDVIAIDTLQDDEIVRLDHEDDFTASFFNSSMACLLECLLVYRDFVSTVLEENGENAFLDTNFNDKQFETLKNGLNYADNGLFEKESFWKSELEMLLAMRQSSR